ncbi:MAG: PilZ domain-containing protein, partial [Thermodesulfobacteriota bacterium]
MAGSQLNRRRSSRIGIDLKVESINSIECNYSIIDISKNGFFIKTDIVYDIGSKFILTFKLPDNPMPISAYCQVLWSNFAGNSNKNPTGIGVR